MSFTLALAGVSWFSCALADVGDGQCDGARPNFESPDYQAFWGGRVIAGTQWRADDAQGVLNMYGLSGQVYKADPATGLPTVFATLPNASDPAIASTYGVGESYPQLGNLCFDADHQMLYVSNFEDGRIYRISAAGVCLRTWDHATGIVGTCAPEAGDQVGAARLGERVWAVQNFNSRVYYSLWVEDQGPESERRKPDLVDRSKRDR